MKHAETKRSRRSVKKTIIRLIISIVIVAIISTVLAWPMALTTVDTNASATKDEIVTTPSVTEAATEKPTQKPTEAATEKPTEKPTEPPTEAPTEAPTEPPTEEPQIEEEEIYEESDAIEEYEWDGQVLNKWIGRIKGPSGEETYYNMPMDGVIYNMKLNGYDYEYSIREDGVKLYGGYVMVAADQRLEGRHLGDLIQTSLGMGIVCDTGTFIYYNPKQLDIAVDWVLDY